MRTGGRRRRPEAPVVLMDLTCPEAQATVLGWYRSGRVSYMHAAPPCGTMSMARERPVPKQFRRRGAPEPRPLHTPAEPYGIPQPTRR